MKEISKSSKTDSGPTDVALAIVVGVVVGTAIGLSRRPRSAPLQLSPGLGS
jgi:hypothetical protein